MSEETILQSKVPPGQAGLSLLNYLSTRFRYQTPDQWRELILKGKVLVNGRLPSHPNQTLGKGSMVAYTVVLKEPPVDTNIQILYEEETFLVAYKPGQLPSHADGNYIKNTFIYLLNQKLAEQGWKGKAQLVHRLDRETSGLMVVAKEKKAGTRLVEQFEAGTVEKEYLAIVHGSICDDTWEVAGAIAQDTDSQVSIRQKVVAEGTPNSKPSLTQFKRINGFDAYTLVQCFPKTGRTNQIRVHLTSIQHPIVGDKLYGRTDEQFLDFVHSVKKGEDLMTLSNLEAPRQFLHASNIRFSHPQTDEKLSFFSPLPNDMEKFIQEKNG